MAFTPTSGALYSDSYSPDGVSNQSSFAQTAAGVSPNDPSTARLASAGLAAGGTNPLSSHFLPDNATFELPKTSC